MLNASFSVDLRRYVIDPHRLFCRHATTWSQLTTSQTIVSNSGLNKAAATVFITDLSSIASINSSDWSCPIHTYLKRRTKISPILKNGNHIWCKINHVIRLVFIFISVSTTYLRSTFWSSCSSLASIPSLFQNRAVNFTNASNLNIRRHQIDIQAVKNPKDTEWELHLNKHIRDIQYNATWLTGLYRMPPRQSFHSIKQSHSQNRTKRQKRNSTSKSFDTIVYSNMEQRHFNYNKYENTTEFVTRNASCVSYICQDSGTDAKKPPDCAEEMQFHPIYGSLKSTALNHLSDGDHQKMTLLLHQVLRESSTVSHTAAWNISIKSLFCVNSIGQSTVATCASTPVHNCVARASSELKSHNWYCGNIKNSEYFNANSMRICPYRVLKLFGRISLHRAHQETPRRSAVRSKKLENPPFSPQLHRSDQCVVEAGHCFCSYPYA